MTEEGSESLSRRTMLRAVAGGVATAATAGAAEAEAETPTPGEESGGDSGGGGNFTWTVEMNDNNKYVPADIKVRPGDTVVWENVGSSAHSVTAYEDNIPEGADYWASGGAGSEQAARDGYPDQGEVAGGESFEHTFETEGVHEYFCIPHEALDMVGSVEVTPDAPTPTPTPEPQEFKPALPETAKAIGVAAAGAMASTLGLAYAFIKYGAD